MANIGKLKRIRAPVPFQNSKSPNIRFLEKHPMFFLVIPTNTGIPNHKTSLFLDGSSAKTPYEHQTGPFWRRRLNTIDESFGANRHREGHHCQHPGRSAGGFFGAGKKWRPVH